MADLETAAETALAKVKQLEEQADQTEEALSALEARITAVTGQVETDGASLFERLRSFVQCVQEQKESLSERGEQAAEDLEEVARDLASTHPEAEGELHGAQEELSALAGEADAGRPRLQAMAEGIEASARQLQDAAQSVESQLAAALTEASELVGVEMVEELKSLQGEVRERAQLLQRAVAEECQAALQRKYDNWLTTLNEVEELVAKAFDDAGEHVAQVVEYSLQECAARHREAVSELAEAVDTLDGVADALQKAITQEQAALDQERVDLEQSALDTGSRMQAMTGALFGVRELMARFTFVQI